MEERPRQNGAGTWDDFRVVDASCAVVVAAAVGAAEVAAVEFAAVEVVVVESAVAEDAFVVAPYVLVDIGGLAASVAVLFGRNAVLFLHRESAAGVSQWNVEGIRRQEKSCELKIRQ